MLSLSQIDADLFSKYASGIQSIVTVIGIVAAGVWAYTTFWELSSTQKSSAELEKTRAEIAELEFRAIVLSIDIKWDVSGEIKEGKRAASVNAVFRNDGKQMLNFQNTALQLVKLSESSGDIDPQEKVFRIKPRLLGDDGIVSDMPNRQFDVGMARRISFLLPPLLPGSYLIQIQSDYIGLNRDDKGNLKESDDGWGQAIEQSVVTVPSATDRSDRSLTDGFQPHPMP